MDFWTSRQITEFIGIEQAFEEFCGADPVLAKLDSIYPGPKSGKFNEWHTQYCPAHDDVTERFVKLFREKILVAWALRDDKEDDDGLALPPEYWAPSVASLTFKNGKAQGLLLDERHKHLANSRVMLRRKDWARWINPAESSDKQEKPRRNRKRDVKADAQRKTSYEQVEAAARRRWPDPKKRPGFKAMVDELIRDEKIKLGSEAIRKILSGNYKPMKSRDITKP